MKFRYLVVDDAAFIRELIKGICSKNGGICVGESEGGKDALDLIRQTLPDIVFLDLVLPMQNGIELAREIRRIWPESRLIAVTSLDQKTIEPQTREVGIDSFVSKPFTSASLLEAIREQLIQKKEVAT